MRKGVCLERNLTEYQRCMLNKEGIIIHTMETGISRNEDERVSYGSYMATIFINNMYTGHASNITLWGPLTLTQLNNMEVVIEIPKRELTIFGDSGGTKWMKELGF